MGKHTVTGRRCSRCGHNEYEVKHVHDYITDNKDNTREYRDGVSFWCTTCSGPGHLFGYFVGKREVVNEQGQQVKRIKPQSPASPQSPSAPLPKP